MIRDTIYGYDADYPAEIDVVDALQANAYLERQDDKWLGVIHYAGVSYRFYLTYDAELGRIILQRLQEQDDQGNPVDVER